METSTRCIFACKSVLYRFPFPTMATLLHPHLLIQLFYLIPLTSKLGPLNSALWTCSQVLKEKNAKYPNLFMYSFITATDFAYHAIIPIDKTSSFADWAR